MGDLFASSPFFYYLCSGIKTTSKTMETKRFRLTYNGVVSEFNASPNGSGGIMTNNTYTSKFYTYAVRPSKANTIGVSTLYEIIAEDGTKTYSFNAKTRVRRGLEVKVEEITDKHVSKPSKKV